MPDIESLSLPQGVQLIECRAGPLPNRLPLFTGERPILVDTGLKDEPEEIILPALRAAGVEPGRLTAIINSHADVDHTGGNAAMLAQCPEARLACSAADREMVESDQALWDKRWNQLAAEHGIAYSDDLRGTLGPGTRADWILQDGDVIQLGGGLALEVIATPGHSLGHLAFMLRPQRILFCGDAVQAEAPPEGRPRLPPQYLDPEIYLATMSRIARLRPRLLVTCHLGAFSGLEIKALLDANRRFVQAVDMALRALLPPGGGNLTVWQLTQGVARAVGRWHADSDLDFAFAVNGHVQQAVRQGWARAESAQWPLRYVGV